MENRKRQLKAHRRNVARKNINSIYHGRSHKLQNLELSTYNSAINNHLNRRPLPSPSSSNSSSMKAFIFNTDSLGRNQYFQSIPKESNDRRVMKYQNTPKTLLFKNPSFNMILRRTLILGGPNFSLNLDKNQLFDRVSGKSYPSDREIIFGNARKLLRENYGWETSRIQWLLDLERRHVEHQSNRKQCYEEDLAELMCCFPISLNMLTGND
ncbi:uncharacterized protein LOC129947739 [Eupeodes corollae]|uniref:uncharacterized protein LOC129947739 n=1 Tax=Eupeodes corollae TaxID=290404 RepID=UPI0024926A17|nr:uncharacterized protein LOC129947739 [Eupeodes corollae]